jgi:hypothetical protein
MTIIAKKILTGSLLSFASSAFMFEAYLEGLGAVGLLGLIWIDHLAELIASPVTDSDSDSDLEPQSDMDSDIESHFDVLEKLRPDLRRAMHQFTSNNYTIKAKTLLLAQQLTRLPEANLDRFKNKYQKLDDPLAKKNKLYKWLDKALWGKNFLHASTALQTIDSRFVLRIVNKPHLDIVENYSQSKNSIVIPVHIHDQAWIGLPSINTMIVGVDTHQNTDLEDSVDSIGSIEYIDSDVE